MQCVWLWKLHLRCVCVCVLHRSLSLSLSPAMMHAHCMYITPLKGWCLIKVINAMLYTMWYIHITTDNAYTVHRVCVCVCLSMNIDETILQSIYRSVEEDVLYELPYRAPCTSCQTWRAREQLSSERRLDWDKWPCIIVKLCGSTADPAALMATAASYPNAHLQTCRSKSTSKHNSFGAIFRHNRMRHIIWLQHRIVDVLIKPDSMTICHALSLSLSLSPSVSIVEISKSCIILSQIARINKFQQARMLLAMW